MIGRATRAPSYPKFLLLPVIAKQRRCRGKNRMNFVFRTKVQFHEISSISSIRKWNPLCNRSHCKINDDNKRMFPSDLPFSAFFAPSFPPPSPPPPPSPSFVLIRRLIFRCFFMHSARACPNVAHLIAEHNLLLRRRGIWGSNKIKKKFEMRKRRNEKRKSPPQPRCSLVHSSLLAPRYSLACSRKKSYFAAS